MSDTKRCTRCGICKPVDEFHKDPRAAKGVRSRCKKCIRHYWRTYQRRVHGNDMEQRNLRVRLANEESRRFATRQGMKWESYEDAIVRQHPNVSDRELARLIEGRSILAVRNRRKLLGVSHAQLSCEKVNDGG